MLSEREFAKFKQLSNKEGIKYKDDIDMRQQAEALHTLAELTLDIYKTELSWKKRLKDEPEGFSFDGEGRCCSFCMQIPSQEIWYSHDGLLCTSCREAFLNKVFPKYILKDIKHSKHKTPQMLARKYGVSTRIIRNLATRGRIKARKSKDGHIVILERENPAMADILSESVGQKKKKSKDISGRL